MNVYISNISVLGHKNISEDTQEMRRSRSAVVPVVEIFIVTKWRITGGLDKHTVEQK